MVSARSKPSIFLKPGWLPGVSHRLPATHEPNANGHKSHEIIDFSALLGSKVQKGWIWKGGFSGAA